MKECSKLCNVESCFLCQRVLPEWLPAITAHKKNYEIKKGAQIFSEGNKVEGIYFVFSGSFKVHKRWDKDKELITRFAKAGDIVGHMGLGQEALYPVTATALETSIVCFLEMGFFESTLKVNVGLTYDLMRFFANELQESQRNMRNLAHMSVKARIAQAFLSLQTQLGADDDGNVKVELSRQDISSFAGTTYETLFKVLNDFTKNSLVLITGRKIKILDVIGLQAIIANDNA
ncbi:Crp/Fnr family transcriptional regulator [Pedobacter changchengzhani]|uniref:Crp/Fnr family transcriptional regulator n=1 Tax=Pedobacter changchengzhani TaxID=2529274 RepID=A0A4R5MID1_9SPHI|nr:Crp/Fnr family transcriptional regulator [Pedobacter changchengzhani]TDG35347.1 Crp/Fnr family transcriptional regulator [Pedobacter changchengzhani]